MPVALTPEQARRVGRGLRILERYPRQYVREPLVGKPRTSGGVRILAHVVGWEQMGLLPRWKYQLKRVSVDDSDALAEVANDTTFGTWPDTYALNIVEFPNQTPGVGYQGDGVDQSRGYPPAFVLEPLGGGTGGVPAVQVVVMAWRVSKPNGSTVWLCDRVNAHNGECE